MSKKNTKNTFTVGGVECEAIKGGCAYPQDFFVVTDPKHFLYREPRDNPPDRETIDSIKEFGVVTPLECMEIVIEGGKTKLAIIFGVDRRKYAEIAFAELRAEGKPLPGEPGSVSSVGKIPFILRNDLTPDEARHHIVIENERRRQKQDERLSHRIAQAQRLYKAQEASAKAKREPFNKGAAIIKICSYYGITKATWERWNALAKLPSESQEPFYGDNPPPLSLVDTLSRQAPSEQLTTITEVVTKGATSTASVNKIVDELPQAPSSPTGGARTRTKPRGAVSESGAPKLYPPRAEKLSIGVDLAKQRFAAILPKFEDKNPKIVKAAIGELCTLVDETFRFVVGEPVESLGKVVKKRSPPKTAAGAAPKKGSAEAARDKHDASVLATIQTNPPDKRWSLEEISQLVGGSKAHASASLVRLAEKGLVQPEGTRRSLRYFLATENAANGVATDNASQSEGQDGSEGEFEPENAEEGDDNSEDGKRTVELDEEQPPQLPMML